MLSFRMSLMECHHVWTVVLQPCSWYPSEWVRCQVIMSEHLYCNLVHDILQNELDAKSTLCSCYPSEWVRCHFIMSERLNGNLVHVILQSWWTSFQIWALFILFILTFRHCSYYPSGWNGWQFIKAEHFWHCSYYPSEWVGWQFINLNTSLLHSDIGHVIL